MMTSNSSEPVTQTADATASAPEMGEKNVQSESSEKPSAFEALKIRAEKAQSEGPKTSEAPAPEPVVPPAAPAAPAPLAFQPNFKFKAFGKDYEIDEMFRPLIKDADSEKKIKDVFSKAYALDDMKTKHESAANEYQSLLGEHQALDRDVRKVMQFRNNKDFDNFFRSLRVSDQEIFDWVQEKINRSQLPDTQRQALDAQANERAQAYDLNMQNQELMTQYQNQAVHARTMQLDMVLSRPDVSKVASSWDERTGKLGAFRDLVIEEAQRVYFSTGKDVSAEEAAQNVLTRFGKFVEQPQAVVQQTPAPGPQPHVPTPQAPTPKPVIPAIQGQGTSPIKQAPKSLDDLRKMAKSMANAQG